MQVYHLFLASDYNPGSCPSGNMNFVIALACIQMKLTPEEAFNAATLNGAAAFRIKWKCWQYSKKENPQKIIITKPITTLTENTLQVW
jgi:imidazolonepropionase